MFVKETRGLSSFFSHLPSLVPSAYIFFSFPSLLFFFFLEFFFLVVILKGNEESCPLFGEYLNPVALTSQNEIFSHRF